MANKKSLCIRCDTECKSNSKKRSVRCQYCNLWIHNDCAGLSEEVYKILSEQSSVIGIFQYTCRSCIAGSAILSQRIIEIDKRVGEVEKQSKKNALEIVEIRDNSKKTDDRVGILETNFEEATERTKDSVFYEMSERESRKCNLVFHGVPEPPRSVKAGAEKKKIDFENIGKICIAIECPVDIETEIKFCARLGKFDPLKPDQTRPLLVGACDVSIKQKILSNARKLKDLPEYKKVGICADLTKLQRRQEADLWAEAASRNEDMSPEDSLNFKWRPTGPRGLQTLARVRRPPVDHVQDPQQGGQGGSEYQETLNPQPGTSGHHPPAREQRDKRPATNSEDEDDLSPVRPPRSSARRE